MAFWWKRREHKAVEASDPTKLPPDYSPDTGSPQEDLARLGPVVRHNHIAYVPAAPWSGVPGVGTANLVYAPDFLLSPPNWYAGNASLRRPNAIRVAIPPVQITQPKTILEGIGGVVAGQLVHQPLLEVDVDNNRSEVGG